ncbi:MAG: hypothetical protein OEW19_10840 [Acidobacteriota bacterium]|nr:hypothetical protein [Acidobacteriota bacterium]
MSSPVDRDAYCRELEAYLCQKNDGHLIRIVGPAFERALSWADQGIPIKVAQAGIDRYFERYYRKGPRRRPVRLEFCEADILDAFDDWRRAVGVSIVAADPGGGPLVEEPAPSPARQRRSLGGQLDAVIARLTVLRGSTELAGVADEALETAIRALDPLRHQAERARGKERQALQDAASRAGRELQAALVDRLRATEQAGLAAEARRELEPFRARMAADAYEHAVESAVARLVRQRFGLPDLTF